MLRSSINHYKQGKTPGAPLQLNLMGGVTIDYPLSFSSRPSQALSTQFNLSSSGEIALLFSFFLSFPFFCALLCLALPFVPSAENGFMLQLSLRSRRSLVSRPAKPLQPTHTLLTSDLPTAQPHSFSTSIASLAISHSFFPQSIIASLALRPSVFTKVTATLPYTTQYV